MNNSFYQTAIHEDIFKRIAGYSYREDCPLPLAELRYLHLLHKDLQGNVKAGEIICNAYIVHDLMDIFFRLYEASYPIEKIRLIDEYAADDESSMRDNNSSCFNFRFISHTSKISKHGYGLAVDINPLYNPYVKEVAGKRVIEPATAEPYLERSRDFPYKIARGDFCYELFIRHGFAWGGNWEGRKDYQHFEVSDEIVRRLYHGWGE